MLYEVHKLRGHIRFLTVSGKILCKDDSSIIF